MTVFADRDAMLSAMPSGGRVAEIGVLHGDWSERLLDALNPRELHLIDPWEAQPESEYADVTNRRTSDWWVWTYQCVTEKFEPYPEVYLHREYSPFAAERFPDAYFDLVYIDGNHAYEAVLADLRAWYPKVKRGGYLAGHDYYTGPPSDETVIEVVPAVTTFLLETRLRMTHITTDTWASYAIQVPA